MARRAYNYACYIVRQEQSADLSDLRSMWANHPVPEWASSPETRVSKQIQNRAIQDVVNAFNSNEAKQKKNPQNARPYTLHFRSLKCTPTEIVHIEKDYKGKACMLRFEPAPGGLETKRNRAECVAIMGSNFKHVGGIKLQDDPRIIARLLAEGEHLKEEAKIKWDKRLNSYHLLYTYEIPRLADPDPTFQTKRIVACDPGCYPFQAWYAPCSGEHGALLVGGTEELMRRCYDIDHRCSSIAKNTSRGKLNRRRRRRMRKRLKRERSRLRGWVKDAHYDAAHTILQQNTLILQPRLAVQELVVTATRNISDRTARAMLTWSHSMFIDRLRSASSRYDGCHVMEITEPGTSKTCTNCGAWKQNLLPRDKIYSCTRCGLSFDRQMAGARNNFLAAYGAAVGMGWDGTE
jgi:transposase